MEVTHFITTCLEKRKELEGGVKRLFHLQKFEKQVKPKVKVVDLVRHVLWYEEQMLHVLHKRELGDHPYWGVDHDHRNRLIKENYLVYGDELIYNKFMNVGKKLSDAMHSIPPGDFLDPTEFGMPQDWQPHDIFDQNLLGHYQSHLNQLTQVLHEKEDR